MRESGLEVVDWIELATGFSQRQWSYILCKDIYSSGIINRRIVSNPKYSVVS